MVASSVVRLLLHGCPAHVAWGVVSVIIFAVQGVSCRWSFTDVEQERHVVFSPTREDGNSTLPVVLVGAIFRIVATVNHVEPGHVLWVFLGSSVLYPAVSAGFGCAIDYIGDENRLLKSAAAAAPPAPWTYTAQYKQIPVDFVGVIDAPIVLCHPYPYPLRARRLPGMIRHAPAENYFKYLVVHPALYDNAYIQDIARELNLDYLGDWYIQWLRDRLRPPAPFYPEEITHTKSQRFLFQEGLVAAFRPNTGWDAAVRLVGRPRLREVAETMLLSQAPFDAVSHALAVRHHVQISKEAVRLFKYYFWNIDLLDSTEMRVLLDLRSNGMLATDAEKESMGQYVSIKKLKHTDPRIVAARLPHTPYAAALAQLELGVLPKRMDLSLLIDEAMHVALLRGMEAVHNGGPVGANMGLSFLQSADTLMRIKQAVVNPEDKLRKDLKRISLATTAKRVPTVAQLTDGRHTTNVHPEPASQQPVVDAEFDEGDDEDGDSDQG